MGARTVVGRYAVYDAIASGGMATVHFGRLLGQAGFTRPVAIKRLLPQFAKDPEFVSMFVDEARVAARIRHPNVVGTIDVVATQGELFLVMEYVEGESLARLCDGAPLPPRIAVAVAIDVLHGLHAVHEANGTRGEPLDVVHRDVSPQNVLVGVDGIARIADFGVAKARGRLQATREGEVKGKRAYLAPEQIRGSVTRRTDVFAASIVLWEMLRGARLFSGEPDFSAPVPALPDVPPAVAQVVVRGLERDPERRFATAREMATALEAALAPATRVEIGEWVERTAAEALARSAEALRTIEATFRGDAALASSREAAAPPSGEPTRPIPGLAAAPRKRRARTFVLLGAPIVAALLVVLVARGKPAPPPESPPRAADDPPAPVETPALVIAPTADPGPKSAPRLKRAPRTVRHAVAPAKVSCSPSYKVDEHGIRRYKPECFE
jgi:serine/threonine-protein kinase